jgi:alkaline phosphatase D
MLDERQYRSPHACPMAGQRGANRISECAELWQEQRTKLGARQEAWLDAKLTASRARWNLLAQGTVMTYVDEMPGPGERFWTDGWNGYPAARDRLLKTIADRRVTNPVVLSGDIHAFLAADLNLRPSDRSSPLIASEFTTTSISSQGVPEKDIQERIAENPNIRFVTGAYRGYLRLDVTPERLQADMVALDAPGDPKSGRSVLRSFVVESGQAGATPAG